MNTMQKVIVPGLVSIGTLAGVVGGSALASTAANAETAANTTTSSSSTQTQNTQPPQFDPTKGGHVGKNGTKEELLTGDTATKATSAAEAAVPGASVLRVENDADGDGTYEAHMKKPDGTYITVFMDSAFKVTSTQTGFGSGPQPQGQPASSFTN